PPPKRLGRARRIGRRHHVASGEHESLGVGLDTRGEPSRARCRTDEAEDGRCVDCSHRTRWYVLDLDALQPLVAEDSPDFGLAQHLDVPRMLAAIREITGHTRAQVAAAQNQPYAPGVLRQEHDALP